MPAVAIPRATILWQRLDVPGLEWCQASPTPTGGRLEGIALVDWEGVPYRLAYSIELDEAARTRRVGLEWRNGSNSGALQLESDGSGAWQLDGRPIPSSTEALDVDLGFSPLTNSLPIWRFGGSLPVGQSRDIAVAWVLFPELEVVVGRQTYERLGERTWRYRSAGFEAQLELGEDGLVDRYADLWRVLSRG
jgi:uncharacterized protein